jgi:hypothetical protein
VEINPDDFYNKLVNEILKVCNTNDKTLVEKVLLLGGEKVGDRYILLNNECWEEYNSYYNIPTALEKIFKVDDVFGKVFCTYPNNIADSKELCSSVEMYDIENALGIEFNED